MLISDVDKVTVTLHWTQQVGKMLVRRGAVCGAAMNFTNTVLSLLPGNLL
jgi:hypothetical protein